MYDVDDQRWAAESDYRNGIKSMFVFYDDDEPEVEVDDDEEEIEVAYTDRNGEHWFVYLTASEKAEYDALNPDEQLDFLESI